MENNQNKRKRPGIPPMANASTPKRNRVEIFMKADNNECKGGKDRTILDPVWGIIELPACLWKIIDTEQFQRLRKLKQLGATELVFPGAHHTRLEHSIGVAYLAKELCVHLKSRQPNLNITEVDILCVTIAGLCHDLGHGPFSHLFDDEFIKGKHNWTHEYGSVKMFDYILQENEISLGDYGIGSNDIEFIRELILGSKIDGGIGNRKGRTKKKSFLYEIINNERNGFDVDKVDYLFRDSYFTGVEIKPGSSKDRFFKMARVREDPNDGTTTICYPEKAATNMLLFFHTRMLMHNNVYQHPVVKACELMIRDVLILANDYLTFENSEGKPFKMSDSVKDMSVFSQLDDGILDLVMYNNDPKLGKAKSLIKRLRRRDIYRKIGYLPLDEEINCSKPEFTDRIGKRMIEISNGKISSDDFIVEIMSIHHGQRGMNPVDNMLFYGKYQDMPRFINENKYGGPMLPTKFEGNTIRVFCKDATKRELVSECFYSWSKEQQRNSPHCMNSQMTPQHSNHGIAERERERPGSAQSVNSENSSRFTFAFIDEDSNLGV